MKFKGNGVYEKVTVYIVFGILILSMLPVMYLGRYNHPIGDDYYYGAETKLVWDETGSLAATMGEAAKGVAYQYENWQGTYSAMFLMYLTPNIFGDTAYRFVTLGILLLLSCGIFYLLKQVVCGFLKGSRELWLLISSMVTLLCVQTVPSQGETFFWYNGSMYYTGFYAVTLFMLGLTIRYLMQPKKYHLPILAFLAVFLAGGNYVSLLPAILIFVLLTAWMIYKKSPKAKGIGCVAVLMIGGLLVSAAAPGNAVRQSDMWKISAHMAIIKSLVQGLRYVYAWIGVWWILAVIVLTPFLWKSFSKMTFQFRYPVLVIGLAYGIFCSMSCPTFYTMNSTGPARAVAIVYYGFILFTLFCYCYLAGHVYRLLERRQLHEKFEKKGAWVGRIMWASVLLIVAVQLFTGSFNQMTTGKAVGILRSGEAKAYEQEYQERMKILEDPEVMDVVFLPYENQPDMLYVGDITGDAEDETNQKTAQYFGKNSVRVQY